jgi:hypothetical protein
MGHTLKENRNGLIVAAALTKAAGTAAGEAAEEMIVRRSPGVVALPSAATRRSLICRRHARAQRDAAHRAEHQRPALRHRRPHHARCRLCGEPAEEKAHRGAVRLGQDDRKKLGFEFTLTMAGYNLIRLPKLVEAAA